MFRYTVTVLALLTFASNAVAVPISYTNYEKSRQGALSTLECKWVATKTIGKNRYTNKSNYDFLCTGGNWGTVTLMLDKNRPAQDKIQRIRLLWRAWNPQVHPAGGEAYVAQKYLNYVVNNFVPRKYAEEVQQAFWGNTNRKWVSQFTKINYTIEPKQGHSIHRLEIVGNSANVPTSNNSRIVSAPSTPKISYQQIVESAPLFQPQKPIPDATPRVKNNPDGSIEINGISAGKRAVNSFVFPKQKLETNTIEVLRSKESQLQVKAPSTKSDDEYNKAWGLTNKYTKEIEEKGSELVNEEIKPTNLEIPPAKPLEEEPTPQKYENEGQQL